MPEIPKFKPSDETLKSIVDLYRDYAEIGAAIVEDVSIGFKEFPPDEELKNILAAKEG